MASPRTGLIQRPPSGSCRVSHTGRPGACSRHRDRPVSGAVDAGEVRAVVAGTHTVTTARDRLVWTVMDHAPTLVGATTEVLADLRALRGCLTTGGSVADPALEDLRVTLSADHRMADDRVAESMDMKLAADVPSSRRSAVMVSGRRSLHGPCTTDPASGWSVTCQSSSIGPDKVCVLCLVGS